MDLSRFYHGGIEGRRTEGVQLSKRLKLTFEKAEKGKGRNTGAPAGYRNPAKPGLATTPEQ
jgi:hypothetical protein